MLHCQSYRGRSQYRIVCSALASARLRVRAESPTGGLPLSGLVAGDSDADGEGVSTLLVPKRGEECFDESVGLAHLGAPPSSPSLCSDSAAATDTTSRTARSWGLLPSGGG